MRPASRRDPPTTTELFDMDLGPDSSGSKLLVRTIASLRDAMPSPKDDFGHTASA